MNSNNEKRSQEAECSSQYNAEDIPADLQKELCLHYRDVESTLTFSPLVEEHDDSLFKLYVRLPLQALDSPHNYSQFKETGRKRKHSEDDYGEDNENPVFIESYKMLFQTSENVFAKNIYVTGDAGMGKTSLTKHLAMTWCQAHFPDESLCEHFIKDELDALKPFDLCFLLHLRDFQGCDLDDMILEFLSRYISGSYSKTSLEKILHEKNCLIILDGLDEWCHPAACSRRDESIPHRKTRQRCTFLTTTRKWKLGTAGLTSKQIDRHVVICSLNASSSRSIENNAVQLLNNNRPGVTGKDVDDFERKVSRACLGELRFVPYINLQLVSMWFDDRALGNSKCDIYSNIIDFTLERGLKLKNISSPEASNSRTNFALPMCMANSRQWNGHIKLLLKLGELAFSSLYHIVKESTLIIDRNTVLEYLNNQEIDFLLKIGLLSQSKDPRPVSEVRQKVSFQHKSLQEFLAAVYITAEWQNERTKTTMMEDVKSVDDILEMSDVFIFVCGLCPEVYKEIESVFEDVIENDKTIIGYRKDPYLSDDTTLLVRHYQNMQMDCLEESIKNGHDGCSIFLHDIIIPIHFPLRIEIDTLKKILKSSAGKVKSISLYNEDTYKMGFFNNIDTTAYQSMEALYVLKCFEPEIMGSVLEGSANALKYLRLDFVECGSFPGFDTLNCLEVLNLNYVRLHHADLRQLYVVLKSRSTLKSLTLENVACFKENSHSCWLITLDLSQLNKLQQLKLRKIHVHGLHLNTAALLKCNLDFRDSIPPNNIQQVVEFVANARMLEELDIDGISPLEPHGIIALNITEQSNLEKLIIEHIPKAPKKLSTTRLSSAGQSSTNLVSHRVVSASSKLQKRKKSAVTGYLDLTISHEMKRLQCLEIRNIKMKSSNWRQLFESVSKLKQLETIVLTEVNIVDRVILLSPEMKSFRSLKLNTVTMTTIAWKRLAKRISTLPQLKELLLVKIDLSDGGDFELLFTPEMKSLQKVKLMKITMKNSAWKKLFCSINDLPQLEHLELNQVDFDDNVLSLSRKKGNLRSVHLEYVKMTASVLRELLISTSRMSKTFRLRVRYMTIRINSSDWKKDTLEDPLEHSHLCCPPESINVQLLKRTRTIQDWSRFLSDLPFIWDR